MSNETRLDILTRINRAGGEQHRAFDHTPVQPSSRPQVEVVRQFAHYAAEYRARVTQTTLETLPATIQSLLDPSGPILLPADLPETWLPPGLDVVRDQQLSTAELNAFQSVLTGCALAVAETGTVVLDHGPAQGRRALTLIPDHHLCVVFAAQVVDTLPEAVERLKEAVRAGRALTWISGPSATSDIELSRVEGVHGPRIVDLVLIEDGQGRAPLP